VSGICKLGEVAICAWLAGVIDGEGSVFLTRGRGRSPILCLNIGMTHKETIDHIKKITGVGSIYPRPAGAHRKALYMWQTSENEAASVLYCCLPYLITKREQAKLALEFREAKKLFHAGGGRPRPAHSLAQLEELKKQMSKLNGRGIGLDRVSV